MNRCSLKKEPEYDTPWIAAPNNGGDVGDMSDIVDELNNLKWERDTLAMEMTAVKCTLAKWIEWARMHGHLEHAAGLADDSRRLISSENA